MAGTQPSDAEDLQLRIVIVGKTGVGKSASGNTILGRNAFESLSTFSSVTLECQKEIGQVEGQTLAVIDTPGLFDTTLTEEELRREIIRCISFAAPGPHVFLVVIQIGRFTREEQETMKILEKIFGEDAACYTMVLFTHGDDLENGVNIDKAICGSRPLHRFINQCGGRYHVFDNKDKPPTQVKELLEKIKTMVQSNGGRCYTNEMLQEAERSIREEMEQLETENPGMGEEEARSQAERKNRFLKGAGIGAGVGSVLGPVGAVLGAAVGAVLIAVKQGDCATQ